MAPAVISAARCDPNSASGKRLAEASASDPREPKKRLDPAAILIAERTPIVTPSLLPGCAI